MTTINTSEEQILKDDIIGSLYAEGNAVKVYGKLAGLPCIGKTYFVHWGEIEKANQYARQQVMQKYGDEVFGSSAQKKHQQSNGTFSATGTGDVVKEASEMGPLIDCSVDFLMDLPEKKEILSEAGGTYDRFLGAVNQFQKYIQGKDEKWISAHDKGGTIKKLNDAVKAFSRSQGPDGDDNVRSFKTIYDVFENEPWKSEVKGGDSSMKEYADKMLKEWKDWGGQAPKEFGTGPMQTNAKKPSNSGKETDGWHWEHAYRIDVKTNFDENWYKRKFKSGILNGIINVIKTDAMSRSTGAASGKTEMSGHKYTADEMLPGDKRKLDGLQWKMTNKVAKDYITFLLGWSRKKEKFIDEKTEQPRPKQENLGVDQAFGKSMADKALSNRGILGRLKQKLFSGGQSNNVVSVAFQMADPEDGWKLVDEKTGKEIETGEVGAEGGDAGAEGGGRGSGSSSSSGGETGSGSGDGKGNGGGTGSSGEELSGDKDMNKLLTLLQRVERLEDTVGVGPGSKGSKNVDESSDPFFGVFDELDMPRRRLVKEACGLNCSSVNALVDDVMFGKGDE